MPTSDSTRFPIFNSHAATESWPSVIQALQKLFVWVVFFFFWADIISDAFSSPTAAGFESKCKQNVSKQRLASPRRRVR